MRSLIKEQTQKFWLDTEIALYIKACTQVVASKYGPWLYPVNQSWVDVGSTVGTNTVTWSTGDKAKVLKIDKILTKSDARKVKKIQPDEIWKYLEVSEGRQVWTFKDNDIYLVPASATTDADFFTVYYLPRVVDVTNLPDSLQMVVALQAAILAKHKDEDVDAYLVETLKQAEAAAMTDLVMTTADQIETFGQFTEEEGLA